MNSMQSDRVLLDAILEFVAQHPHPDVQRFQEAVANWGHDWCEAAAAHLPGADYLPETLAGTTPETHGLVALFDQARGRLRWEQSYTKEDGVVGDDMLAAYGFAEIVGKHGPFLSTRVRSGIGVWGPRITYPIHHHRAEEVYVMLAGSATFQRGDVQEERTVGDVVHVPSMLPHGFRSHEEPIAVVYIWQSGDLREISTFDRRA